MHIHIYSHVFHRVHPCAQSHQRSLSRFPPLSIYVSACLSLALTPPPSLSPSPSLYHSHYLPISLSSLYGSASLSHSLFLSLNFSLSISPARSLFLSLHRSLSLYLSPSLLLSISPSLPLPLSPSLPLSLSPLSLSLSLPPSLPLSISTLLSLSLSRSLSLSLSLALSLSRRSNCYTSFGSSVVYIRIFCEAGITNSIRIPVAHGVMQQPPPGAYGGCRHNVCKCIVNLEMCDKQSTVNVEHLNDSCHYRATLQLYSHSECMVYY